MIKELKVTGPGRTVKGTIKVFIDSHTNSERVKKRNHHVLSEIDGEVYIANTYSHSTLLKNVKDLEAEVREKMIEISKIPPEEDIVEELKKLGYS